MYEIYKKLLCNIGRYIYFRGKKSEILTISTTYIQFIHNVLKSAQN